MSLAAMNWARQQTTGSASRKAVLMAVADYADENGLAWPSQIRIATDTELTDRTVRTALHDLIELGFIVRRSKRGRDGKRETDRLQLCMNDSDRKILPVSGGRKPLPVEQPPENNVETTGNSFQNHRKMTVRPPEAVSAEPTIEPSVEPPLNRSEAIASGGRAAIQPFSEADQCWMEGKANLVLCGMTPKQAGDLIGAMLKLRHPHAEILTATREAVRAGTGDAQRYVRAILKPAADKPRRTAPERSSAATRFRDRLEARHGSQRSRYEDDGHGPVIDHESDERPHGSVH